MNTSILTSEIAQELLELGTATVGEASGLPCVCDPEFSSIWPGGKMCGQAYTVRCHPGDNLAIHHALEGAENLNVLVVDTAGHPGGYWGEILSVAAMMKGVKGLLINGGVRDVDAIEKMKFPIFSKYIALAGTVKHEQGDLQVPLCMAGVCVKPGDIVLADRDGILFLPSQALEGTLITARSRMEKEATIMTQLREGYTTVELFNLKKRV